MTNSSPQLEIITQLLDAVYPSFAMLAGMELDLFTPLKDGSLSVEQLASSIGVQPIKLRPLLYTLVIAGLLTVEDDLFSNTLEADHYLVRGKPTYLGELQELTANNWGNILKTAKTIRAGAPLVQYDYHSMSQDELVALLRGLHPNAIRDAERLMERHDFSKYKTLLDVGGGSGGLAIAITQAHPHLKSTIIDLPLVTPITRQFVAEAGATDRIEILTHDVINHPLSEAYDVIVARHIIQVLSANDSRILLSNLASALKVGGVLHLIGWVLDDTRVSPQNIVGYNLVLLNAYKDGQAYTEQEYRNWLAKAGLIDIERIVLSDGTSILTAHKPH